MAVAGGWVGAWWWVWCGVEVALGGGRVWWLWRCGVVVVGEYGEGGLEEREN